MAANPQIRQNIRAVISRVSGKNAFSKIELSQIERELINNIKIKEALKFSSINVNRNPFTINIQQKNIITSIIDRFDNEILAQRLLNSFNESIRLNSIVIKR